MRHWKASPTEAVSVLEGGGGALGIQSVASFLLKRNTLLLAKTKWPFVSRVILLTKPATGRLKGRSLPIFHAL